MEALRSVVPPGTQSEPSPWTGIPAWSGSESVTVPLPAPLAAQGTVMVWLRLDAPIANGPGVETDGDTVLTFPGLAKLNLWWYHGYGGIVWEAETGPNVALEVPGLPGPQWLHLCYTWDAERGLYQGYLNGTPIKMPGTSTNPWQPAQVGEVQVNATRWALGGLQVGSAWCDAEAALAAVPSVYRGALDHTVGAQALGSLEPDAWRGETCWRMPLASADEVAGWRMEGPGEVAFEDGWMRMWSTMPDAPGNGGHIVHWCDRDLPADFLLEFDVRVETRHGLNIVFFCAKGRNGEDALDPSLSERTGIFGHYTMGDLNCYHVSYFAGPGRTTTNLRKNHGFYLVDNGPIGIRSGDHGVHHVALLKQGGAIRLGVDGRRVMDWFDDGLQYGPVLGAGKMALRQMKPTTAAYRNLRVSTLRQA